MEALYKWIDHFEDLGLIQQELLAAIQHDYRKHTHAFTYPQQYIAEQCPRFWSWLAPRLLTDTRLMRFYVTAPRSELAPHIDGAPVTVPFGLNIPVLNCEDTTMTWWRVPQDHITRWQEHGDYGYMSSYKMIAGARSSAQIWDQITVARPCFVRNDIMHSVENPRDTWRIMLSIRFPLHPVLWRRLDQVMELEGLFCG